MPSSTRCGSPSRTLRSMKAPGSPSSALQMTNFSRALGLVDRAPLEAGRVAAAAAAPQARGRDLLDHVERGHLGDGLLQRLVGALGDAGLDPLGVDAAASSRGRSCSAWRRRPRSRRRAGPSRACPRPRPRRRCGRPWPGRPSRRGASRPRPAPGRAGPASHRPRQPVPKTSTVAVGALLLHRLLEGLAHGLAPVREAARRRRTRPRGSACSARAARSFSCSSRRASVLMAAPVFGAGGAVGPRRDALERRLGADLARHLAVEDDGGGEAAGAQAARGDERDLAVLGRLAGLDAVLLLERLRGSGPRPSRSRRCPCTRRRCARPGGFIEKKL